MSWQTIEFLRVLVELGQLGLEVYDRIRDWLDDTPASSGGSSGVTVVVQAPGHATPEEAPEENGYLP